MSINLTTYLTGQDVTPTEDAIVYEFATSGDGIIYGCDVSVQSDNKIFIDGGHGIFHGRKFTVLEETMSIPLSTSGTENKKLIIRMDLANQAEPIQFLVVNSDYSLTQQDNLNLINGVWEMELATMSVTNTAVTNLKQTFKLLERGASKVNVEDVEGLTTVLNKKADKTNVQIYKLTQDSGYSKRPNVSSWDNVIEPGNYYGEGLSNAITSSVGRMHCIVTSPKNGYVMQLGSDATNNTFGIRTQDGGSWTEWRILGGLNAKTYDIVLLKGAKPSKNATETDNKIIKIGNTAYMHARLDLSGVEKLWTPTIAQVPQELVPTVKSYQSKKKQIIVPNTLCSSTTFANSPSAVETGESRSRPGVAQSAGGDIAFEYNDYTNKCSNKVKIYLQTTDSIRSSATDWCGSFAWYVGEVN